MRLVSAGSTRCTAPNTLRTVYRHTEQVRAQVSTRVSCHGLGDATEQQCRGRQHTLELLPWCMRVVQRQPLAKSPAKTHLRARVHACTPIAYAYAHVRTRTHPCAPQHCLCLRYACCVCRRRGRHLQRHAARYAKVPTVLASASCVLCVACCVQIRHKLYALLCTRCVTCVALCALRCMRCVVSSDGRCS